MTRDDETASAISTALVTIWQFAYYPGYDDPDEQPPDMDPAALAAYMRLLLEESMLHADSARERLESEHDRRMMKLECVAFRREIERLRSVIDSMKDAAPWMDEYSNAPIPT